jgi:hypothetical protein
MPRPACGEVRITGDRVVLIHCDEDAQRARYVRGYRAVSEVYADADGTLTVQVAPESAWYRWAADLALTRPERCPGSRPWPADLVWAE